MTQDQGLSTLLLQNQQTIERLKARIAKKAEAEAEARKLRAYKEAGPDGTLPTRPRPARSA